MPCCTWQRKLTISVLLLAAITLTIWIKVIRPYQEEQWNIHETQRERTLASIFQQPPRRSIHESKIALPAHHSITKRVFCIDARNAIVALVGFDSTGLKQHEEVVVAIYDPSGNTRLHVLAHGTSFQATAVIEIDNGTYCIHVEFGSSSSWFRTTPTNTLPGEMRKPMTAENAAAADIDDENIMSEEEEEEAEAATAATPSEHDLTATEAEEPVDKDEGIQPAINATEKSINATTATTPATVINVTVPSFAVAVATTVSQIQQRFVILDLDLRFDAAFPKETPWFGSRVLYWICALTWSAARFVFRTISYGFWHMLDLIQALVLGSIVAFLMNVALGNFGTPFTFALTVISCCYVFMFQV